jgi:hypothetical protein
LRETPFQRQLTFLGLVRSIPGHGSRSREILCRLIFCAGHEFRRGGSKQIRPLRAHRPHNPTRTLSDIPCVRVSDVVTPCTKNNPFGRLQHTDACDDVWTVDMPLRMTPMQCVLDARNTQKITPSRQLLYCTFASRCRCFLSISPAIYRAKVSASAQYNGTWKYGNRYFIGGLRPASLRLCSNIFTTRICPIYVAARLNGHFAERRENFTRELPLLIFMALRSQRRWEMHK